MSFRSKNAYLPGIFMLLFLMGLSVRAQAASVSYIDFEGLAGSLGFNFFDPGAPEMVKDDFFMENLGPADPGAAVFDPTIASGPQPGSMVGNIGSAYFNQIAPVALTNSQGAFNIHGLLIGPRTGAPGPISGSVTGFFENGGTSVINFSGVASSTQLSPNWHKLVRVEFSPNIQLGTDLSLDNIHASVPAPATFALMFLALTVLAGVKGLRR